MFVRQSVLSVRRNVVRLFLVLPALLISSHVLEAQAAPRTGPGDPRMAMRTAAQNAMKPLAWMIGEWEGPASHEHAPGQKIEVVQREIVQSASFGTALLVQGRGTLHAGGREQVVFEAAAIVSWDAGTRQFVLGASSGGRAGSFDIVVEGSKMTWGFPMGDKERVRYVIEQTADGKWKELGFVSHDGGATWTQSMEMLLTRKR